MVLLGSTTTSPAFAVTRNPNGTVTVRLITLAGIAGANHKLATMGVRARILDLVYEARYVASIHPCEGPPSGTVRTMTFDPAKIPPRALLLLAPVPEGHVFYFSAVRGRNGDVVKGTLLARVRALAAARASIHNKKFATPGPSVPVTVPSIDGARTVRVYCPSRFSPGAR